MLFSTAESDVIDLEETLLNTLLWPALEEHHVFSSHFFVSRQEEIVLRSLPLHSQAFNIALLQTAF